MPSLCSGPSHGARLPRRSVPSPYDNPRDLAQSPPTSTPLLPSQTSPAARPQAHSSLGASVPSNTPDAPGLGTAASSVPRA